MSGIQKLYSFLNEIENKSVKVDVQELDMEALNDVMGTKKDEFNEARVDLFRKNTGIKLTKEEETYFCLSDCVLKWTRKEQEPKEGLLSGGFSFNSIPTLYKTGDTFWETSMKKFKKVEDAAKTDEKLLHQLRWIESATSEESGIYAPQYGCILPEKDKLPAQFYFYDSGLIFPLPFHSYGEYVEALAASAAVRCWQYFYVDPELIIQQNKEVSYMSWSLYVLSDLEPGISDKEINPKIQSDRLDLINEHLGRCVQLLPKSFPWLDFSHHDKQYAAFSKLYKKSK